MFGKSKEKKKNDNELESYGVWVKHGASEDTSPVEADTNLDFGSELDLPEFEGDAFADSDFSDMFKDDTQEESEDALDFDTTLSADELANITDDSEITTEEIDLDTTFETDDEVPVVEEPVSEEFNLDETSVEEPAAEDFGIEETSVEEPVAEDFGLDDITVEETTDSLNTEETASDDIFDVFETETTEETPVNSEEVSLDSFEDISDDFNIFETETTPASEELPVEETSDDAFVITEESEDPVVTEESEEVTFGDDEEISLDDFMDEGFSDESVAAGNNGFEPGKEPGAAVSGDEEISLDDFIDAGEFETTPDIPVPQEETVVDEPPLEMEISFDDSADTVETEDNIAADVSFDEDQYDENTEETTEEAVTEEVSLDDFGSSTPSDSSDIETEEIDLSDFGIDAGAEETPITQDVEEAKLKETVVDYDLCVANDNAAAAPVVNVIPETVEEVSDIEEVEEIDVEETPAESNTTSVNNSLLEQIVADLSGLKDEINQLKVNLAEIKEHENVSVVADTSDDIFENDTEIDEGGFFAADDTDDTIALSADELSNIMNTTSVVEETVEPVVTEESEPTIEETSVDIDEVSADEPSFEETTEEPVIEETSEEELSISDDDTLAFNYEDENLQEPDMNDITIEESDFTEEDELPSEISIEKSDDILVESDTNDFMDSVADSTPEAIEETVVEEVTEEPVIEEEIIETENVEEPIQEEVPAEEPVTDDFTAETEPVIDDSDISFETVDSLMADNISEDSGFTAEPETAFETAEETVVEEEPVIEETIVEEDPFVEEETSVDTDFSELDQSNNDLSDSNIDYLTAKNDTTEEAVNTDLKQDIKSVLLYMDQLLENLPEDKIIEFAKSDEFTTYKKLFSELGLS